MPVRSVHLLHDGYFHIDLGLLVYLKSSYYGKDYKAALKPMLVRTEGMNVLIDTGIADLPPKLAPHYNVERDGRRIDKSLKSLGLEPKDIDLVINTHLHLDHAGNNKMFRDARFIVQKGELDTAYDPPRWFRGGYFTDSFEGIEFTEVDGDVKIADGIGVIRTGGHTPGHQAVLVDTAPKPFLYCGDIAAIRENIEKRNLPGILWDPKEAADAIERFAGMDVEHVYSHDNAQLELGTDHPPPRTLK
ncbi:MAG: N-acyl homoserine lactonase family protein [Gammaproteobacteria bacterium]